MAPRGRTTILTAAVVSTILRIAAGRRPPAPAFTTRTITTTDTIGTGTTATFLPRSTPTTTTTTTTGRLLLLLLLITKVTMCHHQRLLLAAEDISTSNKASGSKVELAVRATKQEDSNAKERIDRVVEVVEGLAAKVDEMAKKMEEKNIQEK